MISTTFNRYIWLVNTLIQAGRLTFEEISRKWERSSLGEGKPLPIRTFHDHRKAVEELFQINSITSKTYPPYAKTRRANGCSTHSVQPIS